MAATDGLFEEGTTTNGLAVEVREEATERGYVFEEALESGEIVSVLKESPYVYLTGGGFDVAGLDSDMVVLEGSFSYYLDGDRGFAVLLGGGTGADYFYVNGSSVSFYNSTTLVNSVVTSSTENILWLSLTAGGTLSARVNEATSVTMGTVSLPDGFKLVPFGNEGEISLPAVALNMYETSVNAPVYAVTEGIDFTAYAPPTVENWGAGTSNPNLITAEQYKYMADAGFTKALALYEGRVGNSGLMANQKAEQDALLALALAAQYGIEYYVLHEEFYNYARENGSDTTGLEEIFAANASYVEHTAFGGMFAADEPPIPASELDIGELEDVYLLVKWYYENVGKGEAIVNLLPYGSVNATIRERYEIYLDYYFEHIAPLVGYVSYDHYPLDETTAGVNELNETHLLNLEMMAERCKDTDTELRAFVWTRTEDESATGHRGAASANDIRLQVYTNLAFGVKEMTYYTYTNYYRNGNGVSQSLIDCQTGARTDAYFWAQEVNNEVRRFEDAYLNFAWESVTYYDTGAVNTQFSLLENAVTSHSRISSLTSSADILIGNFSDADGEMGATDGFMIVNYTDPYGIETGLKDSVNVTFNNATKALVYQNGVRKVIELENGACTLNLDAGEGVFVIPFNG